VIHDLEPVADPEAALRALGLDPRPWSAPPHTHFGAHHHERSKRLFVRSGEITFNGRVLSATAGIRIDAGTEHSADVGDSGVECVEAFEGEGGTGRPVVQPR
jgi:hypothetical protein